MELYEYTAAALSSMLRQKKCSSKELTASVLERIHKVEPKVGAYVTLCEDQAMEQARHIDERRALGEALSPLAGIPIAIKDNICT